MESRRLTKELIRNYQKYLITEEKSEVTIEKYLRDILRFYYYLEQKPVDKEIVISYKKKIEKDYAVSSINSMLASLNGLFTFLQWYDCKVKQLKIQKSVFRNEERELTREEYRRLVQAAKEHKSDRLNMVMQTICNTGIRISELKFITVEAVRAGRAEVCCKGKIRSILIPKALQKMLFRYIKDKRIVSGMVFITKNGMPLDRSNIWREMKRLCEQAKVDSRKVFPHNLRHLFAFTFYSLEKDIVKLAGILGHSNIETTRIYTMTNETEHLKKMSLMRLLIV